MCLVVYITYHGIYILNYIAANISIHKSFMHLGAQCVIVCKDSIVKYYIYAYGRFFVLLFVISYGIHTSNHLKLHVSMHVIPPSFAIFLQ